jgi:hypothetical protein
LKRYIAGAGVVAAIGLLLGAVVGPLPAIVGGDAVASLQGSERVDAINHIRQTLLQTAGGTVALGVLAMTVRTYYLSKRAQFTDRYLKVVGLLASDKVHERVGGVYAAEQLMTESEYDHPTIVEVLSAFVREWPGHESYPDDQTLPADWATVGPRLGRKKPPADVQAALTVIGRRPKIPEPRRLNLDGADLRGANLKSANLVGASLVGARLDDANLFGAILDDANLHHASLAFVDLRTASMNHAYMASCTLRGAYLAPSMRYIYLVDADCSGANFGGSDLSNARFNDCDLRSAYLWDCNLAKTWFNCVDARGAQFAYEGDGSPEETVSSKGMTVEQLRRVVVDRNTVVPEYLRGPAGILVEHDGELNWPKLASIA